MKGKLVLFSGGIDSTTLLYDVLSKAYGDRVVCLTFVNPRNHFEVNVARKIASSLKLDHVIIPTKEFDSTKEVFYRNNIYLDYAMNVCKEKGLDEIYFATHYPDHRYLGKYYRDCSPDFCTEKWLEFRQYGITLRTPYVHWALWRVIDRARELNVPLDRLRWCDGDKRDNCGKCLKCLYVNELLKGTFNPNLNIRELRLYINNLCDKSCSFCTYDAYEGMPDYMSDDTIEQVVQFIERWRIERVMISGREPLYNVMHFVKVLNAMPSWTKVMLNTNGTNLDDLASGEIKRLKKILVSFNEENEPYVPPWMREYITPYVVVERVADLERYDFTGYKKPYVRKDVWLKDDEKIPKVDSYDVPELHYRCISGLKVLTVMTNGDVIGCAKDTYRGRYPANVIGHISDLDLPKKIKVIDRPVCEIMAKEIRWYS